ncbi:hypothetical protein JNK13_04700 [bacterium]|nr:hypothetical protein [bacterium]
MSDRQTPTAQILLSLGQAFERTSSYPVGSEMLKKLEQAVVNRRATLADFTDAILLEPLFTIRMLKEAVLAGQSWPEDSIELLSFVTRKLGPQGVLTLCQNATETKRFTTILSRAALMIDLRKLTRLQALIAEETLKRSGNFPTPQITHEVIYLVSIMMNAPALLVHFYYPQVIDAAARRSRLHSHALTQAISEALGISIEELLQTTLNSINLPKTCIEICLDAFEGAVTRTAETPYQTIIPALHTAQLVASMFMIDESSDSLESSARVGAILGWASEETLTEIMRKIPEVERILQLRELPALPSQPSRFQPKEEKQVPNTPPAELEPYLNELQQAVRNMESTSSIISTVMEALAEGLNFDRVILMLSDESGSELRGHMSLGRKMNLNPKTLKRSMKVCLLSSDSQQDQQKQSLPFIDEPLFSDAACFVTIPVGGSPLEPSGVIYADIVQAAELNPTQVIDQRKKDSIRMLSELVTQAVTRKDQERKRLI